MKMDLVYFTPLCSDSPGDEEKKDCRVFFFLTHPLISAVEKKNYIGELGLFRERRL